MCIQHLSIPQTLKDTISIVNWWPLDINAFHLFWKELIWILAEDTDLQASLAGKVPSATLCTTAAIKRSAGAVRPPGMPCPCSPSSPPIICPYHVQSLSGLCSHHSGAFHPDPSAPYTSLTPLLTAWLQWPLVPYGLWMGFPSAFLLTKWYLFPQIKEWAPYYLGIRKARWGGYRTQELSSLWLKFVQQMSKSWMWQLI